MQNSFFNNGYALIGGRDVPFDLVTVQRQFRIWIPKSFTEDSSLDYRYTYLSDTGKSPLGIAFRFTPVSSGELRDKMIVNYFGQGSAYTFLEGEGPNQICFRESINTGTFMSIYSMRFAIKMNDGVLFGCFNCSSDYKSDWKEVVLEMLKSIEKV